MRGRLNASLRVGFGVRAVSSHPRTMRIGIGGGWVAVRNDGERIFPLVGRATSARLDRRRPRPRD